jgi:hypothetical protein
MIFRGLLVLAIGILVAGNLGILMMCLVAMARQTDEHASPADLAWMPAKDAVES